MIPTPAVIERSSNLASPVNNSDSKLVTATILIKLSKNHLQDPV